MKNIKVLVLIAIIIAASLVAAFGQTYAGPRQLKIEHLVRQTFPGYFGRRQNYPKLIPEAFFPIGWSKDGKFAYYVEPVDEACGCYYARLVVQDLRTDKVIWKFDYEQGGQDDNGKSKEPGNVRELWKANQAMFSQKLAEHGIVASNLAMLGKTFSANGRSYTAKAAVKMGVNPEFDEKRVHIFAINVSNARLGSKTVFEMETNMGDYGSYLDAGLIGVLKSPHENRVAIVAIEVQRGWEGPPHTGNIHVIGADLTTGFKKK